MIIISLTLISCKKSIEDKIVGKWYFNNASINCINPDNDTAQSSYHDKFSNIFDNQTQQKIEAREYYEFFENGKYYYKDKNNEPQNGTWKIFNDELELNNEQNDDNKKLKFNLISDKKLVFLTKVHWYLSDTGKNHYHKTSNYYEKK